MKYFLSLNILFLCFTSTVIPAQINITYPTSRAIFQRNNSNQSPIYIAGNYTTFADKIEARVIARPMNPAQGTTTDWTVIQSNPSNGYYFGSLNVSGGWYDLEVRHWNGTLLLGTTSIQRVGVGEVFLIAGQSNATGDESLKNQGNYGPMAKDDRVSIVNYTVGFTTNYGGITLPRADFSHLDSTFNIAPFGNSAWCWGALGDTLTKRLNVPIAFFNGGWSGTGSNAWRESANDSTATPFNFFNFPRGMPYGNLREALNFYVAQFGVRAVLWHQGETDNVQEVDRNTYGSNLKTVITKSREHAGKSSLAWVVSKASRFKGFQITNSRIWQPVIEAQNDVIGLNGTGQSNFTTQVFEGPSTDGLIGPNVRTSDSIHFVGNGHRKLASAWNQKLNTGFFTDSTPYLAIPPPNISSDCDGASSLKVSISNSYFSPKWNDNFTADNNLSSSYNYSASSGAFRIKVKDSNNNTLISPQISIPNNFSGLIPIVNQNSGTWHDYATWKCGRIPTSLDIVIISAGKEVIINSGLIGRFKKIELKGKLSFLNTSRLQN